MRTDEQTGLRRSLRQRHMTMISLGGVIGAMAFVDDVRSQLIPSFLSLAVVLGAAFLRYREPAARRARTGAQPSRT